MIPARTPTRRPPYMPTLGGPHFPPKKNPAASDLISNIKEYHRRISTAEFLAFFHFTANGFSFHFCLGFGNNSPTFIILISQIERHQGIIILINALVHFRNALRILLFAFFCFNFLFWNIPRSVMGIIWLINKNSPPIAMMSDESYYIINYIHFEFKSREDLQEIIWIDSKG